MLPSTPTRRHALAGGVLVIAAALAVGRLALGSDHQDTPLVELNPTQDMTDVYAFPGSASGRIALVLNSWAFLTPAQTPGVSFDNSLLYQFKVDNDGDAKEDQVIQVTFTGTGANQTVEVRGPIAPPVQGAMGNRVANVAPAVTGKVNTVLGSPTGIQVFAGPRDDPFFIDLEAAFCILPDRKPVTGPLATTCALTPNPSAPFFFRPANQAVDYVKGFNVLSIVIELPSSMLEHGAPGKLGIWGTISR
jgi:Domain of unknown function (DUF4331)